MTNLLDGNRYDDTAAKPKVVDSWATNYSEYIYMCVFSSTFLIMTLWAKWMLKSKCSIKLQMFNVYDMVHIIIIALHSEMSCELHLIVNQKKKKQSWNGTLYRNTQI